MKVKIITAVDAQKLERDINDFLKTIEFHSIQTTTTAVGTVTYFTACIVYYEELS